MVDDIMTSDSVAKLLEGVQFPAAEALMKDNVETPGFAELMKNPVFLSFLADLGARLDPQGVGGALGGATKEFVKNLSTGQKLAKDKKEREDKFGTILKMLSSPSSLVNKVEFNPEKGTISIGASDPNKAMPDVLTSTTSLTGPRDVKIPADPDDIMSMDQSIFDDIFAK